MANILSISSIRDDSVIDNYLDYLGIKFRPHEMQTLKALCRTLIRSNISQGGLDNFILSYSIRQISKEFDMLRITNTSVINIELKTTFSYDDVLLQLQRNYYYLKFINSNTLLFTFIGDSSKIYRLSPSRDSLVEINPSMLIDAIESQEPKFVEDLDRLFNPKNYLISPFNTTERFINNEYFLTNHQHEIKKSVHDLLHEAGASVISIRGKAGTGKSLLMYDIAHTMQNENILVVHCGILNSGHIELISHGFNIIPIKSLAQNLNSSMSLSYKTILIDEAQRLKHAQTISLMDYHNTNNTDLIFGYDAQQLLRDTEVGESVASLRLIEANSSSTFTLTNKIRSNENVANFILALYDLENRYKLRLPCADISVVYFPNYSQAAAHIKSKHKYTYIPFTPSTFIENHHPIDMIAKQLGIQLTAHSVIGQEFNNVIVVLDQHFSYSTEGKLRATSRTGNVYSQIRMLFQIVTRTKNKLEIVVVNNEPLLEKIVRLLT